MRPTARTFLFLLLFIIIPSFASGSKIHEYTLDNGLKLFVKENHRAPVVVSTVWYKVGSGYEPNGITGISHVLEHMMFGGTKRHGPNAVSRMIAASGGEDNALTNFDFTEYYAILSANRLALAFDLEADRMRNLQFNDAFFKKEMQVVMEEWRMRMKDNPQMRTYVRFLAAAHVTNPYHHAPIGWIDDLRNMTLSDVQRWYQKWYVPNNAIVVVVGDVVPDDVYRLAKHYFGPVQSRKLPVIKPRREVEPLGERTVTVHVHAKLPLVLMGYNVPVLKVATQTWEPYALTVAAAILGMDNSARLPRDLVRKRQVASSIDVSYNPFRCADTLFVFSGVPMQGHAVKSLEDAIQSEIMQLKKTLVTKDELARVKVQVIANKIYARDSLENEVQEIGSLESVGLSWRVADDFVKNIEAVTPEQIQTVVRRYLVLKRLTVGILKPIPIPKKVHRRR